jgi:hypothetical protein
LPSFDKTIKVHPKILEPNNLSYVDSFFSFLSSRLLYEYNFIHGNDFYGSFLGIKNDFKMNIFDDLEYLVQSEFFHNKKGTLFQVEDFSHLINVESVKLKPINIDGSIKSQLSVKSLNNDIFEDIFESGVDTDKPSLVVTNTDTDTDNNFVSLVDMTNIDLLTSENVKNSFHSSFHSSSSCSSRTSHTNDIDIQMEDDDTQMEDDDSKIEGDNNFSEDDEDYSTLADETIMLTIPKFPVQIICMEQCDDTFNNFILSENISDEEWISAFMQIIMILLTYQQAFSLTHNDLHTNNIMYTTTNKKFIYYVYKKKTYKVPTYGKIYKIIDFGRAIYKYDGKIFCSDSFQTGGDAATQYNTEPFYNSNKPRLEPNFSFDLCRLACSIFDYLVEDLDTIKCLENCSPVVRIITEWCIDDNGINVLYKNNGVERYPDFKLYKMIARCVHKHTPQAQLERPEFSKFITNTKHVPSTEYLINIDDIPCHC